MVIHIYLVLIPILLIVAAVFAATEASLLSLSRPQLESLREDRPSLHRAIKNLIQRPDELLSTLIIGNEAISILIGTFIVTLLELYFAELNDNTVLLFSILISSSLSLVFSEILPKVLAFRLPVLTASFLVYPATWAHLLFTPFRKIFLGLSRRLLYLLNIRHNTTQALSEKDFLTLVEVGAESGSLDVDEQQMIYNVFQFSDRPISSVMTPWKDVFTISESLPLSSVLDFVRKKSFSRVPVISDRHGHVVGVLYTKELLKLLLASNVEDQVDAMEHAIFPPYIASSSKKVSKLFREFKAKKIHMALVVDEFGRQLGVVTLEDLLNALFQTQKKPSGEKT